MRRPDTDDDVSGTSGTSGELTASDVTWFPGLDRPGGPRRDRLGPYRLLQQIGFGGMSQVYLAERDDEHFRQQVAIKLIVAASETQSMVRRFRTERQILADLKHPNIARIYDGGATDDGRLYFVLEYIDGMAIDLYCRQEGLLLEGRLELFRAVCSAVSYAHQNLIVHRDLKPGNILVTPHGVPKLLDFGIAKILRPEHVDPLEDTATGHRPMTLQYASPEQVAAGAITTATDVYALGVLLYELLTEKRPYNVRGLAPIEVERLVCEKEPTRPSAAIARGRRKAMIRPRQLGGDLDNIVMKALAKDPEHRYASVDQLSEDLRLHLEGLPVATARPSGLAYRFGKMVHRHVVAVVGAAAFVTLLIGFVVLLAGQRAQLTRERDQAQQVAAFLVDVFAEADPGHNQGRTVTAREILDRGAEQVRQLGEESAQTTLMVAIATVYRRLGAYEPAESLLQEAVQISTRLHGDASPETAAALFEQGVLYSDMRRDESAEPLLERALKIRLDTLEASHPDVARSLDGLGGFYARLKEYGRAEKLLRQALAIRRQLGEHPDLSLTLGSLGNLHYHRAEYEEAAALYRRTLRISENESDLLRVVATCNNLAVAYTRLGRYDEARSLFERALSILEEEPWYLASLVRASRGALHRARGEYDEAEAIFLLALEELEPHRAQHDARARIGLELAYVYRDRGELERAESSLRGVLAVFEGAYRPDHLVIATAHAEIAALEAVSGRTLEATARYHRAVAIVESVLNREGELRGARILLARFHVGQGILFHDGGDPQKAREYWNRAREITEPLTVHGIVEVLDVHARALLLLGRAEEARPFVEELWQVGWRGPALFALSREKGITVSSSGGPPPDPG